MPGERSIVARLEAVRVELVDATKAFNDAETALCKAATEHRSVFCLVQVEQLEGTPCPLMREALREAVAARSAADKQHGIALDRYEKAKKGMRTALSFMDPDPKRVLSSVGAQPIGEGEVA